jgi:predicted lipoprotein with Yx(FWY)xxD motif
MRPYVSRGRLLAAGLLAGMFFLAACGSSGSSAGSGPGGSATGKPAGAGGHPTVASGTGVKTVSTKIGTVLTNTQGRTLYWFAIDTPTTSKCSGSCVTYWPPLAGPVKAAPGVSLPGKFGTIKRSDGSVQATYDGHPLYTYSGDAKPGDTSGNGLNLSGGKWYAMTPSGAKAAAAVKSSSPSSGGGNGGGGYG